MGCGYVPNFIEKMSSLTYMSIREVIKARIEEGRLFHLRPVMADDPVRRHMFITEEVRLLLDGPWTNSRMQARCGFLRGNLESFIKGEVISASLSLDKKADAFMGRLQPAEDETWDIRSRKPKPGLRVLGRFSEQDHFIAIMCCPRSVSVDWFSRDFLGDGDSKEWRDAIQQCKAVWRQLFEPYDPYSGDKINDYISTDFVLA